LQGEEIAVLASGAILKNALEACRKLSEISKKPALFSVHTLKPIDSKLVRMLATRFNRIVTVEEHSTTGGLGGAVAEILAQLPGPKARLRMVGLADGFSTIVGDQEYLRGTYGMSPQAIVQAILEQ
jgi:transketolase